MSLRVIYSRHYDIRACGLERLHPFDTRKHSGAFRLLRARFGERFDRLVERVDRPANTNELLSVHTADYLGSLHRSAVIADVLEVPQAARVPAWLLRRLVLRPMRWATRGTILAGHAAIEHGAAINLAGGYHHASRARGEGFCVYADIALMIHDLWGAELLDPSVTILYIDTDAHMGNGVARCFPQDTRVRLFDMYNASIYPRDEVAANRIDHPVLLAPGTNDDDYLDALRKQLPRFIDAFRGPAAFAIYNAGTDPYRDDQLGGLGLSDRAILERDAFVLSALTDLGVPWVMLPSGGYSAQSHRLIADTVGLCIEKRTS